MSFLVESPLPIIFFGVIVEAVLATIFVSTQKAGVLVGMLGVVVLVLAMVGLEWLVVTQGEEVEATIDQIAKAMKADDWKKVDTYLAPDADQTRAQARFAKRHIRVTDTKVRHLEVQINEHTSPPTAMATFDGVIYYEGKDHFTAPGWYPARFEVEFRKAGDRWLVTDHVKIEAQRL